jgi:hypothetical protein
MSNILKGEAKAQAASLGAAVKELARLQKVQKNAAAVGGVSLLLIASPSLTSGILSV